MSVDKSKQNLDSILRALLENGYVIDDPVLLDEAADSMYVGKIWQTATRDRDSRLFVLVFDDKKKLYRVCSNTFEFTVKNGFSSDELSQIAGMLAAAKVSVKREERRRGILPFFHYLEHTTWKFPNGKELKLSSFEDKNYSVKPKDVKSAVSL